MEGPFISIYVGTPNRVKKLIEVKTINLRKSAFKYLILDTHLNPKNLSIFDVWETRHDTFDILLLTYKRMMKRKLKLYLH